jgi:5-methyltetrahydropteroyltriglutamate--homocysteine methyltransferase
MARSSILGYPRIGRNRELKRAVERYWSGKHGEQEVLSVAREIRQAAWDVQDKHGIDQIPANDFSYYDQVLDTICLLGLVPDRHDQKSSTVDIDTYFAMARGAAGAPALELTKWFDTNYHYIVPEFRKKQAFKLFSSKVIVEAKEAGQLGIKTKPVLIGPVSYLLLGKEKEPGFNRIDLIENLLPVYLDILGQLEENGIEWVQLDEPYLVLDLNEKEKAAFQYVYNTIKKSFPSLKTMLATYFEGIGDNLPLVTSLPICALHIDLVRCPDQLESVLQSLPEKTSISLGLVDGRNVWKNDFQRSMEMIRKAMNKLGEERVMIAPSCSLLHSPCDLDLETGEKILAPEIKNWLAFAKQKLDEVVTLKQLSCSGTDAAALKKLALNQSAVESRKVSPLIHSDQVKQRAASLAAKDAHRMSPFAVRKKKQHRFLELPSFPTTTIGSFPQTKEVRSWRAQFKKGQITGKEYTLLLKHEIERVIRWQEQVGLDVLVHGEFERNDMVEYFGEQLEGFAFSSNGWVQSYGSRCVKPPIIYGDVSRPEPMTVAWSQYAQSLTAKIVKGMLTGPLTLLQWSFVRNDQPRSETCMQIALAIRDEVMDLEKAGIKIIQIDEPAIREGLPLRKADWKGYLDWAVRAFRIAASGVRDETQIHTHMCYSEFNDIIEEIAAMDADVITIECSRSQMELLDAFAAFQYPNEIGPGVYDIHSPRVPTQAEMVRLLHKAKEVIPEKQLWVNPDCGLKTRGWEETRKALAEMVEAAKTLREK